MSKKDAAILFVIAGIGVLAYFLLKDKLTAPNGGGDYIPTVTPITPKNERRAAPIAQTPTMGSLQTLIGQPVAKPSTQTFVALNPNTGTTVGVTQTTKYFKVTPSNLPATKKAFQNTLLKLAPLNIKKMLFPVFRK